ncbi:MAG: heat-inducible transcriptional repressor HrcA [Eubacteriales bacterium]
MELTERKKRILKSVVDSYIKSGEPVGSKYLTTSYDFSVSSATIRNEMSELEEMGYLEQPHTSAGRVPTSLGYRIYINSLMEKYLLTIEELNLLNELTNFKIGELNRTFEQASKIISEMTNYASFSVLRSPENIAQRFETVLIDQSSFLIVMICENDVVKSQRVKLGETLSEQALKTIQEALNAALTKKSADEINMPAFMAFERTLGEYGYLASECVKAVYEMLSGNNKEHVHIDGVAKLLSYPEFSCVSNAKCVLSLIEEQNNLLELLYGSKSDKLNIYIGDDNINDNNNNNSDNLNKSAGKFLLPTKDTSFVFHPISVNGQTVGAIGVIGPKRMNYKKVIASLNYLASGISVELNFKEGENKDGGEPYNLNIDESRDGKPPPGR